MAKTIAAFIVKKTAKLPIYLSIKIDVLFYSTLEERAQRLFSTKGKKSLDPNLLAKSKPGKSTRNKDLERQRDIAFLESQVYK